MNIGYIYIRTNEYWDLYNAYKLGKTLSILDRDQTYITSEIKRGTFVMIIEIDVNILDNIEKKLHLYFNEQNFHINFNGGIEFYKKEIINFIIPYFDINNIKYKILSKDEINNLTRLNRIKQIFKKINIKLLIESLKLFNQNKKYIWDNRDYQTKIINYCKNKLLLENKIYIELPTGSGKSYIVYNLFLFIKSNFIIIISPRKIINNQNISQKYLEILQDNYEILNYSDNNNINNILESKNKKIIICCIQSINKIYKKLLNYNNLIIWFDEAHWSVEKWINNNDKYKKFLLLNNDCIKYRIFTSASPDKSIVLQNKNTFGELYSPIKIKELINLKWLSKIEPYIYSENIENVNNIKYIIEDFTEKFKKFGFSFHNNQKNAYILFKNHYIQYINKKTKIKPFLLTSNNLYTDIKLEYNYRDIKIFENTEYSIGYVVAKYSIGYDFNKLDFIYFSDPKLSIQDIKQCIGRGIRPDELGINGTNKNKILMISLPVYINNDIKNKYESIIHVLKYLLYDIEIPLNEINFNNRYIINNIINNNINDDFIGINDVKSMLLNLLEYNEITYNQAKKIIAEKNIKNKKSYYELCKIDIRLPKNPEIVFKDKFINWIEYLSIEQIYYNLETCKNKVSNYLLSYPEIKKNDLELTIICNELCKIDPLFPPNDLWIDYYNVNVLQDIINITYNKKKNSSNIL